MAGAGATLRKSANWRALFGGFAPLARGLKCVPAPMKKELFLGFCTRICLEGNESSCSEGCHESVFKLCHCSQVME